uniref:Putative secreted protein n=1 Tax=Panstrongylus lignarius TaxID=156445 RepID=A0A224XRJ0_9HEMI
MLQFRVALFVGQKPVVSTLTLKSTPHRLAPLVVICSLNSSIIVFETVMSLNMPSSLDVNWHPHSVFNFEIIFFSLSSETDLFNNNLLARWFL